MRIEDEDNQDNSFCWCLEGDDKLRHRQKVAERYLCCFLFQLKLANNSVMVCDAVEQILKLLLPDGNYQYDHNTLQYNSISKAFMLCGETQYDEAIVELQKARFHTEKMMKYSKATRYCFTAPLFDRLLGEKDKTDWDTTDVEDFICAELQGQRSLYFAKNRKMV